MYTLVTITHSGNKGNWEGKCLVRHNYPKKRKRINFVYYVVTITLSCYKGNTQGESNIWVNDILAKGIRWGKSALRHHNKFLQQREDKRRYNTLMTIRKHHVKENSHAMLLQ